MISNTGWLEKFENYFGAHAGFTEKEFIQMASDTFPLVIPVRDQYMVAKYPAFEKALIICHSHRIFRIPFPIQLFHLH
jgi:hypothetical protein